MFFSGSSRQTSLMISAIINLNIIPTKTQIIAHANISFTMAFSSASEAESSESVLGSAILIDGVSVIQTIRSLSIFFESLRKLFRNFFPLNFKDVSKDFSYYFRAFVYLWTTLNISSSEPLPALTNFITSFSHFEHTIVPLLSFQT